jgi:hypothetical protein
MTGPIDHESIIPHPHHRITAFQFQQRATVNTYPIEGGAWAPASTFDG